MKKHATGVCSIPGCGGKFVAMDFCGRHYQAWKKHGDPLSSKPKRGDFEGSIRKDGYVRFQRGNVRKLAHIEVAERALGRPLPRGAIVHHVDENPTNNEPSNLVICPDQAYHMLLHKRMRALDACGKPDWLKCVHCKQWDKPSNLSVGSNKSYHRACEAASARAARAAKTPEQIELLNMRRRR